MVVTDFASPSDSQIRIKRIMINSGQSQVAMTDERCLDSIQQVAAVLQQWQVTSVFLVADAGAYRHSGAQALLEPLLQPYRVTCFSDFEPNPRFENVMAGMAEFQKSQAQVVIAVGGGTAIDIAKLIAALPPDPAQAELVITHGAALAETFCPLIAIPTTSGTGSEATQFAVVYHQHTKYSVDQPGLLPQYCVLDPGLTMSLPPLITAHTGLDAFAQAIESIWSVRCTDESFRDAYEAARLAWQHLPAAVSAPTSAARAAMMRASHLAGRAINRTRTTAAHAVSYTLTSDYGVPHGQAVAVMLGPMLACNAAAQTNELNDVRGLDYTQQRMRQILNLLGCQTPEEANQAIQTLVHSLGCEVRLSRLGVKKPEELVAMVNKVNVDRLSNNPRKFTRRALFELLHSIL